MLPAVRYVFDFLTQPVPMHMADGHLLCNRMSSSSYNCLSPVLLRGSVCAGQGLYH